MNTGSSITNNQESHTCKTIYDSCGGGGEGKAGGWGEGVLYVQKICNLYYGGYRIMCSLSKAKKKGLLLKSPPLVEICFWKIDFPFAKWVSSELDSVSRLQRGNKHPETIASGPSDLYFSYVFIIQNFKSIYRIISSHAKRTEFF